MDKVQYNNARFSFGAINEWQFSPVASCGAPNRTTLFYYLDFVILFFVFAAWKQWLLYHDFALMNVHKYIVRWGVCVYITKCGGQFFFIDIFFSFICTGVKHNYFSYSKTCFILILFYKFRRIVVIIHLKC